MIDAGELAQLRGINGTFGQLLAMYHLLPSRLKREFAGVVALMLGGALAEFLAIGAVLPFLSIFADPQIVTRVPTVQRIATEMGITTDRQLLLAAAALFCGAAILAGAVRLALVWFSQGFVFKLAHHLGVAVQQRILYQPYSYHVGQNTSEILAGLEKVQILLFNILIPLMAAFSSGVIAIFIIAMLTYIDPMTAIVAALGFISVYGVISFASKRRLATCSRTINDAYAARLQVAQESLGGVRDILLDQSQPFYIARFARIDDRFRRAQAMAAFIGSGPRFVIESAGMVLIAVLAVLVTSRETGIVGALPVLGALALGAQRLLPLLQQVYFGLSSLSAGQAMVADLHTLLSLEIDADAIGRKRPAPLPFQSVIRFESIWFRYPTRTEPVLKDIDIEIRQGSRVAFIGTTGSGKSTAIDLLMGLVAPSQGRITIDGVPLDDGNRAAWQARIAHVPQAIFLADASIEENIAFGVPTKEIDRERVHLATEQAQLSEFIAQLPDGFDTRVGERGVQLSGGQRQRLGIARALYKNASVLILDEATSALDDRTEAALVRSLDALSTNLTIIMIAHRLSTVAMCDQIISMEAGQVVESGSYEAVIATPALAR